MIEAQGGVDTNNPDRGDPMSAQTSNRSAAPFRVTLGYVPKQTKNPNGVVL